MSEMQSLGDMFHALIPEEYRKGSEPISADDFARKQCEWYNETEGTLTGIDCPECKNRGNFQLLNENGDRVMRECKCMAKRRYVQMMQNSGLGDLYEKCTFDSYIVKMEWQRDAKEKALQYAAKDGNGWFFFGGSSGSGKTHLCTAICSELAKRGRTIKYVQWKRLFAELVQTKFKQYEREQIFNDCVNADVLYIDDFLKTPRNVTPSEEMLSYALEIIDARYKADKKTILSTEFRCNEILSFDEALGSRIAEKSNRDHEFVTREAGKNFRTSNK